MNRKMDLKILLVFVLASFSLSPLAQRSPAQTGEWKKLMKKSKGFTLFKRKENNSSIFGIKVEGQIKAPLPSLLALLRDVEGAVRWTPDLNEKITLENISDTKAITYSVNFLPWPLDNRDLVLVNELKLDREKKLLYVLSSSVEHPAKPVTKKRVRALIGYSNFGFRPIDKETTFVELEVFVDPKGSIPNWLTNAMQKKWPVKFLLNLEREAQKEKYTVNDGIQKMIEELLGLLDRPKDYFDAYQ